ncbi:MAG TPA: universal stress protein [Solirubrobacteraceae bacterium]|nr:universal stress protein [Solirubrobacteraceae bacterium]
MTHTIDAQPVGAADRDAAAVARLLGGSAATLVPTRVLVAPHGYADSRPRHLERIGVAYDGSTESNLALAEARRFAEASGARVIVRDVIKAPQFGEGAWSAEILAMHRALGERVRRALGPQISLEVSVALGPTRLELVAFSDSVDLLICGAQHLGLGPGSELGAVAEDLARRCTSPVLIVSRPDPAPAAPPAPRRDSSTPWT